MLLDFFSADKGLQDENGDTANADQEKVNHASSIASTPRYVASAPGHLEVVQMLLEAKAEKRIRPQALAQALHVQRREVI